MARTEHGSPLDAPFQGESKKHETARSLAEAALRAEEHGDFTKADQLFDEAERTDPDALATVLASAPPEHVRRPPTPASDRDRDVAGLTRTIEPGVTHVPPETLDEQ